MTNKLKGKKAEGYVDVCIGVVALLSVLVLILNVYSFLVLKQDLDEITEQLIEVATETGCFGEEFDKRVESMKERYFAFDAEGSAENWYNVSEKKVQLGNIMRVTVTVRTKLIGIGVVEIPITASGERSGLSEHYWKG